jgi:succinoglycan biosynthesis transport protein ExoP
MNADDVLYTLFRHKWLILSFIAVGLLAAGAVAFKRPPAYTSYAKLMIHYVEDRPQAAVNPEVAVNPMATSSGLLTTEKEVVKTGDVAMNAAGMVGPARILQNKGDDLRTAAAIVGGGLEVEIPMGTPILTISYRNHDKRIVQDVLSAVIKAYIEKHQAVHGDAGMNKFFEEKLEQTRKDLTATEDNIRNIKAHANILSVEAKKEGIQTEIASWETKLHEQEVELDARQSVLGDSGERPGGVTSGIEKIPPPEVIREYGEIANDHDSLNRSLRELQQHYTAAYPTVRAAKTRLDASMARKAQLELQYPALAKMDLTTGGTNSPGEELIKMNMLKANVQATRRMLSNLTASSTQVMDLEPMLADLQRIKQLQETNYARYMHAVDSQSRAQELSSGKPVNITVLDSPSPPALDQKKFLKLVGGAFFAFVIAGVGLAFLIDLFWDRSLRRPVDIQRKLKEPVFLTIPDSVAGLPQLHGPDFGGGNTSDSMAVAAWQPENALDFYTAGLGERVATYFDLANQQAKKPKLVGVTSPHHGAGVSSLARGLATALSQSGEGSVLLVDMNREGAKAFTNGSGQVDISQALRLEERDGSKVQDNLYVASVTENPEALATTTQTRLVKMVPELKASDYNYIVFDMPPVAPTTPTQRFSNHLDLVLLIVESEKTGQAAAARANSLLQESKAKVAPVLNRYRPYVPARLAHEG